jgi:hypothetical protein
MPTEAGKSVEKLYWDLVRAMSPEEKYRKTVQMTGEFRAQVAAQIREEQPCIGERALKFAVARRIYCDEPKVIQMLDEAEKAEQECPHKSSDSRQRLSGGDRRTDRGQTDP